MEGLQCGTSIAAKFQGSEDQVEGCKNRGRDLDSWTRGLEEGTGKARGE